MMKSYWFFLIFVSIFFVGCSDFKKPTDDCDSLSSGGGPYDSQRYDCPAGDPSNDDIDFGSNLFNLGNLEAGVEYYRIYNVVNKGKAKIFDFEVYVEGAEEITNSCGERFNPNQSCSIQVKIEETVARDNLQAFLRIKDRSGKLSKSIPLNYNIKPSYPKEIIYETFEIDAKTKKVVFGPLKDRFDNIIKENWRFQTNRKISDQNLAPYLQTSIIKPSDSNGMVEVFVQTDRIETTQEVDSADLTFFSSKVYAEGDSVFEQFSITFLNDRPTIDATEQVFSVVEDSVSNSLDLKKGTDAKNRKLSYILVTPPVNGVLSNCLFGSNFITLVNCGYSPNKNFSGTDSFYYKVSNGVAESFQTAKVVINIQNTNDAPILGGSLSFDVNEKQSNAFVLLPGFDPDGDSLTYEIINSPTKGNLNCNSINCSYTPGTNQLGSDSFVYRAKDPFNARSSSVTVNLNIKQINEAPQLGGSFLVNTTEDQPVSFSLPSATDPENDSLVYKIKTPPAKGVLKDCINFNNDLTCNYIPNKNIDSADTFSYVAIDPSGLESDPKIVSIAISQINDAPEFATNYQEVITVVNTQVSFILLAAIDPESNPVSYEMITPPAQGLLQDCLSTATNLTCRYNPPTGINNSSVSFTYLARDNQGAASAIRTVKILIQSGNQNPTAPIGFNLSGVEDSQLDFSLNQGSDQETASQYLRYRMGTQTPKNGVVSNCMTQAGSSGVSDITCAYTPNKDFYGTDSFSYLVVDGQGNQSSEAIVNIEISNSNDSPYFSILDKSLSLNEDQPIDFTLDTAIDPDQENISYSIKVPPSSGSLSSGCITNIGQSNNCKYTPNLNYNGTDFFILQASDASSSNGELKVNVNIQKINDAPVINSMAQVLVNEDNPLEFNLNTANDVDSSVSEILYSLVTAPSKGILSNCLGINNVPGINCSYLPRSNETGIDSFSYRAFDGELYSNTITVSININATNDLPFFENSYLGPIRVQRGSSISFKIEKANDIENDAISYQIVTNPGKGSIGSCFTGNPLSCSYTSQEDAGGTDSFVYRAKDAGGNSYNDVQVDFIIDDKRIERISQVYMSGLNGIAQKQLLSTERNVYELGDNLFFNGSYQSNNYFNNFLLMKNSSGAVTQLGNAMIKNKNIVYDNKLFVFDETSTGSFIRIYNQKGTLTSVPYTEATNAFYPIVFNDNIYIGSTSGALFKINLLKINNNDYSYFEKIAEKEKLGVSSSSGLIEPIGVYNNELYFSYPNQNGLKKIAKINKQDQVTLVMDIAEVAGSSYLGDFLYYENNNKSIQKIYFFAGASAAEKRLYALNLKLDLEDSIESITSSLTAQGNLIDPQILKQNASKDVIVFKNPVTKKILSLDPLLNTLIEYSISDVKEVAVSKDKTKVVIISSQGEVKVASGDILNTIASVPEILADWAIGLDLDRIILKKQNTNELVTLETQNTLSPIDISANFSIERNFIQSNSKIFAYSPKSSIGGTVYELFEFKSDVSYKISKSQATQLETLVSGATGSSYLITKLPDKGTLNNCMGINSSNLDNSCIYLPNPQQVGSDNFKYQIKYPDHSTKEILVNLESMNNKPEFDNNFDLFSFAKIDDLGGEIEEYVYVLGELFFTVNNGNNKILYRYNEAEGLREISRNISGYGNFEHNDQYLFFVDKTIPQTVYQYDLDAKTITKIFSDPVQGSSIQIRDLAIIDDSLFAIAKNYGFPPVNRLLKINLNINDFSVIPLLPGYENGLFIKAKNSFFIETSDQFSFFNKLSNSFVDTKSLPDPIYIGKTYVKDDNTLVFNTRKQIGSTIVSNIVAYDIETKKNVKEVVLNFLGARSESIATPVLHSGGSPVLLVEVRDSNNTSSSIELFRSTQNTRENRVLAFSGPYLYSEQIKQDNTGFMVLSRNSSWSKVEFKRYGSREKNYVLNGATTKLYLTPAKDFNLDTLTYELVNPPNYGTLTNCLGLNGSDSKDLTCDYNHTNNQSSAVIDSFSYRAFDGFSYSEVKVVPLSIKNSAPKFLIENELSYSAVQNIPLSITIPIAQDLDGNQVFYLVTQNPSKGSVSGCISSIQQLVFSSRNCEYKSNLGQSGIDFFKVRAFDGISYSEELTININISSDLSPQFLSSNQQEYISNVNGTYKIILEKAIDPMGNPLTYSIVSNPSAGSLSNCFVIEATRLVCTYTPNNINQEQQDSFTYRATNGTYTSTPRTVKLNTINSAITGELGDFKLTVDGPTLYKNGINNINELSSLNGYSWKASSKTLTLPANREYSFKSFSIEPKTKVVFEAFSETTPGSTHGWTRVYSQSDCLIDGELRAYGGQTNSGAAQSVSATAIDSENLIFNLAAYAPGKYGGTGGGSSILQKSADFYFAGNPTLFKGGTGELGVGQTGSETLGGSRGKDGLSVFIKCINSFSGDGLVNLNGENGAAGENGLEGSEDTEAQISFGGNGGGGGGNGGHSGQLQIKTKNFTFQGQLLTFGGQGGLGGSGGYPSFIFESPFSATAGTNGEDGEPGNNASCRISEQNNLYSLCP